MRASITSAWHVSTEYNFFVSTSQSPVIRVGTQGWNYDAWIGPFYPDGTRPADFLSTYARAFDTVEVDSTFYAVPSAHTVRAWFDRTPDRFSFAVKLPQAITHEARFRRPAATETLALFADRMRALGEKLGPVLIQCAPDFSPAELPALANFLETLPSDMRFAIEFRDRRWITDATRTFLSAHRVALALTDARWIPRAQVFECARQPTTDFGYVRLIGPNRNVVDYSRVQIDRSSDAEHWAGLLLQLLVLAVLFDIRVYVNNHWSGHSPFSARDVQRRLGQQPVDPQRLRAQLSLF